MAPGMKKYVERLFDGKTQLNEALHSLMEDGRTGAGIDERKRQRTILRIDDGRWQCRRYQLGAGARLSGACQRLFRSAGQSVDRECDGVDHGYERELIDKWAG